MNTPWKRAVRPLPASGGPGRSGPAAHPPIVQACGPARRLRPVGCRHRTVGAAPADGFRRLTVGVALAGVAVLATAALAQAGGIRINTTRSIPLGIYSVSDAVVGKGADVLICPPPGPLFAEARSRGYLGAGFCAGGYGYLMKRIVATAGDVVTVADEGVRVNGVLLPASVPRAVDAGGRALPRFRTEAYTLGGTEVLLMSPASPTSFDGRYFGPVDRAQIQAVLTALLTW